jgi:hypothetical protein
MEQLVSECGVRGGGCTDDQVLKAAPKSYRRVDHWVALHAKSGTDTIKKMIMRATMLCAVQRCRLLSVHCITSFL